MKQICYFVKDYFKAAQNHQIRFVHAFGLIPVILYNMREKQGCSTSMKSYAIWPK